MLLSLEQRSKGWQRTVASSPCSAEPVFSAAASSDICAIANFQSGSRQGIEIGGTVSLAVMMIRNFDPSTPIFMANDLSRMRLPALTLL
jgi:hypothetical protein